jgi:hypothetical protein
MKSTPLRIVRSTVRRSELRSLTEQQFGDMVKAVAGVVAED